jgi:hypothetical protein
MLTKSIFILTLTSIYLCSFGQTNVDEIAVLTEALKIVDYQEPIIYIKTLNKNYESKYLTDKINRNSFYIREGDVIDPITGIVDSVGKNLDSLILTETEVNYLIQVISEPINWEENLFNNSIAVNDQSEAWEKYVEIRKNVKSKKALYYFSFTKPIFIRNKTICLLAIAAICGGECGITNFSFYRKVNGKWGKWIRISGGEF